MRPNVAIALLLSGAAIVVPLALLHRNGAPQPVQQNAVSLTPAAPPSAKPETAIPPQSQGSETAAAPSNMISNSQSNTVESNQEAYVEERISQLGDLGMDDDPASLNTILSELNNREPRIREAAVQAAIQFGSRDAIPRLTDAATQTDDPHEKAAILDAIEYLKLPSITEVMQQRKAAQAKAQNP
jgi:hypothetical protein